MHDFVGLQPFAKDPELTSDCASSRRVIAGDHDRLDTRCPRRSHGFDGFGTRRIGETNQSAELEPRLVGPLADRDSEHAKAARGHLRVFRERVLRHPSTQLDHDLDRALEIEHAVRPKHRGALALRVEGVDADAWPLSFDVGAPNSALCCARQDGYFGRVSDALLRGFIVELGVAARRRCVDEPSLVGRPQLADRHHAGRQSSGLVGADDGRTAQRLDGRKTTDEDVPLRDALHADRERDGHDRR